MKRKIRKCFRSGSEDHMIKKFPKPQKDNEKRQKQVRSNKKGDRTCDNGKNRDDQRYMHLWHDCIAHTVNPQIGRAWIHCMCVIQ